MLVHRYLRPARPIPVSSGTILESPAHASFADSYRISSTARPFHSEADFRPFGMSALRNLASFLPSSASGGVLDLARA